MSGGASREAGMERWVWEHAADWLDGTPGSSTLGSLDPDFLQRRAAAGTRKVLAFRKVAPSGRLRLSQLGRKSPFAAGLSERLWPLRELVRRARVTPSIR
jgi:hypothetical protein